MLKLRFTVFVLSLLVLFAGCSSATNPTDTKEEPFKFQDGDLIFQDLDCGGLCDAIEEVTHSFNGRRFSHVGLVISDNDSLNVIEAIGNDVHITPLSKFMARSPVSKDTLRYAVGRLKSEFQSLNPPAIRFALNKIGTPYDDEFIYDNGKYYCSELIYDAYKIANANEPVFELEPMTFKTPGTESAMPVWIEYYKQLGKDIPEGKPGCNPSGLSRSDKLEIIAEF